MRSSPFLLAAWLLVLSAAPPPSRVLAHDLRPKVVREIVRLQGYLAAPPPGTAVQGERILLVLGERYRLRVTDAQVLSAGDAGPAATEPDELRLQGDRSVLAQIAAISSQRLTLLGERRPGGAEIFLLALDVCPPLAGH